MLVGACQYHHPDGQRYLRNQVELHRKHGMQVQALLQCARLASALWKHHHCKEILQCMTTVSQSQLYNPGS